MAIYINTRKSCFLWSSLGSSNLVENDIYGVIGWFKNSRFLSFNS